MASAKVCPSCGNVLRRTDMPDFATVARYVAVELVFWTAVALALAFLGSPRGEGEPYAALAAMAIVVWLFLRPLQRAACQAFAERAQYHCEMCNRRFEGDGLREVEWRSA
ncbi:MAG: hypothetical protein ACREVS_11135 [Burkholderiales bacterium]